VLGKEEPVDQRKRRPKSRDWIPVDQGVAIYKRSGSPYWQIYLYPEGAKKATQYSLRTRDKLSALDVARDKANAIFAGRWNVSLRGSKLVTVAAKYCRARWEKRRVISTARMRYRALRYFINWLAGIGIHTIEKVTPQHVESYLRWRRTQSFTVYRKEYFFERRGYQRNSDGKKKRELEGWTLNKDLAHLKAMSRWSVRNGFLRRDFTETVEPYVVEKKVKWTPEPNEVKKLLRELRGVPRDWVLFEANTSPRLRDSLRLTKHDVDLRRGVIEIGHKKGKVAGKEHRLNRVALAIARKRVRKAGENGLLFPNANGIMHDGKSLRKTLIAASKRANLPHPITAQVLRRFALTRFAPEMEVAELKAHAAHASVQTTLDFYAAKLASRRAPPVTLTP
jgi:site-specific recombinase XerD